MDDNSRTIIGRSSSISTVTDTSWSSTSKAMFVVFLGDFGVVPLGARGGDENEFSADIENVEDEDDRMNDRLHLSVVMVCTRTRVP